MRSISNTYLFLPSKDQFRLNTPSRFDSNVALVHSKTCLVREGCAYTVKISASYDIGLFLLC